MFFKKRITQKQLIKFLLDYDQNYKTSNLRMQKTLFIIFGTLSKEDVDYLDVESFEFERWMYGPVNKELYYNFKAGLLSLYDGVKVTFSSELKEKVKKISDYLMDFSNTDLIRFTHDLNCWIEKKDFERMENSEIIRDFKNVIVEYDEQR